MNIILYSTHCPRCSVLEKKLQQKNIKYNEVNDIDKMISMGIQSTPMLSVDGILMPYTQAVQWVNAR